MHHSMKVEMVMCLTKSRLAIRVLNYCRPHINAKRLNDVAHTLLGLATMYCSCCCVNCS